MFVWHCFFENLSHGISGWVLQSIFFLSNKLLHGMKNPLKNVLLKVSLSRFDSLTKFFSRHLADDNYVVVIFDGNSNF